MKTSVPFYSQHSDGVPKDWRPYSCAIVCLKMALDAHANFIDCPVPDIESLIEEGNRRGGYIDKVGWKHDTLIDIAMSHGILAHRDEFKDNPNEGISKIKMFLRGGHLVIISVSTDHSDPSTFHQVILVDCQGEDFYYNDPAKKSIEDGEMVLISRDNLVKYWRKLAIFFHKN